MAKYKKTTIVQWSGMDSHWYVYEDRVAADDWAYVQGNVIHMAIFPQEERKTMNGVAYLSVFPESTIDDMSVI